MLRQLIFDVWVMDWRRNHARDSERRLHHQRTYHRDAARPSATYGLHSALQRQNHDARTHEKNSEPVPHSWTLTQKGHGKNRDEHHAQLVDGSDFRSIADLKSAKVADP